MQIKNWREYQHYKHRSPPWIKLHRGLLDDPEWHALDGDASKMLAMCWLIASELDGKLPEPKKLAFRLRCEEAKVTATLAKLSHWIEGVASTPLAPCLRDACTEKSRVEKRRDIVLNEPEGFAEFYKSYPKRQARKKAVKAYIAARREVSHETIMAALDRAKRSDSRFREFQFTPQPSSWLNGGGWTDETKPSQQAQTGNFL